MQTATAESAAPDLKARPSSTSSLARPLPLRPIRSTATDTGHYRRLTLIQTHTHTHTHFEEEEKLKMSCCELCEESLENENVLCEVQFVDKHVVGTAELKIAKVGGREHAFTTRRFRRIHHIDTIIVCTVLRRQKCWVLVVKSFVRVSH